MPAMFADDGDFIHGAKAVAAAVGPSLRRQLGDGVAIFLVVKGNALDDAAQGAESGVVRRGHGLSGTERIGEGMINWTGGRCKQFTLWKKKRRSTKGTKKDEGRGSTFFFVSLRALRGSIS